MKTLRFIGKKLSDQIVDAKEGDIYLDSITNQLKIYNGRFWIDLYYDDINADCNREFKVRYITNMISGLVFEDIVKAVLYNWKYYAAMLIRYTEYSNKTKEEFDNKMIEKISKELSGLTIQEMIQYIITEYDIM